MRLTGWIRAHIPFSRRVSDQLRVGAGVAISLTGLCILLSSAFWGIPPIV